MQRLITSDSAFAWMNMQRQVDSRLFLLVEGDDEDSVLYGHLNEDEVSILVLGGKPNVLATSRLLEAKPIKGVFAVVDRDLDELTGLARSYPSGLAATTGYDLISDVIAIRPDLLRRAARVHGKDSYDSIISFSGQKFLELCYEICFVMAGLRLVNVEYSLGLNLRDFPMERVINSDCSPKSAVDFIDVANSRSKTSADVDSAEKLVIAAMQRIGANVRFCGGHDLVGAAAALLRKKGAKGIGTQGLAASLITAVDCETIGQLPVVDDLRDWAEGYSRVAFECKLPGLN